LDSSDKDRAKKRATDCDDLQAEFERDIIRERTQAGLQAARARGRTGGRPKALSPKKIEMARALFSDKNNAVDEICKTLRISRVTLYRYVKPTEAEVSEKVSHQ
jgi:DNA invertase Pin-like site-specific DNA recombinase